MSCKTKGILKAAEKAALNCYRVLHTGKGERLSSVSPPAMWLRAYTVFLLLYWWGRPPDEITELTGYPEAMEILARMRKSKMLHGDRLDVTERERSRGLFASVIDGLVGTGEIKAGVLCPACRKPMNRAGKSTSGKQRWRCTKCPKSTVFPGSSPEDRMRVPAGDVLADSLAVVDRPLKKERPMPPPDQRGRGADVSDAEAIRPEGALMPNNPKHFSLANKKHLEMFVGILLFQGALCPVCGYATRKTSKRWGRCKKCGERVERKELPTLDDLRRDSVPIMDIEDAVK